MMSKIFNALAASLLFLVFLTGATFLYSIFFEEPYLSYKAMPFEVDGFGYPGKAIVYTIIRCNNSARTKTYTTTRNIQKMGGNQTPFVLPSTDLTVEPGCETSRPTINVIPDNATPGIYRFMGMAKVPGIFGVHEVPWSTKFFEVKAAPIKASEIVLIPEGKEIKIEVAP